MRDTPVIIISDIHGNLQALEAFDKDIGNRFSNAKQLPLINCGDILDYGANPSECAELLSGYNVAVSVMGNHDSAIVCNTHDLRFDTPHGKLSLEITRNLVDDELVRALRKDLVSVGCFEDIIAFHGSINDMWENLYEFSDDTVSELGRYSNKIFVFGHSHLQFMFRKNSNLFVNPGSIGQPRNACPKCHYAVIYPDDTVEMIRVEYDIDGAARSIIECGYPKFLATRLYLGI